LIVFILGWAKGFVNVFFLFWGAMGSFFWLLGLFFDFLFAFGLRFGLGLKPIT
jgi:hypothetical protein